MPPRKYYGVQKSQNRSRDLAGPGALATKGKLGILLGFMLRLFLFEVVTLNVDASTS